MSKIEQNEAAKPSWLQKAKLAVAAFAFLAAAFVGVSAVADEAPVEDETARRSKAVKKSNSKIIRIDGGQAYARSGSWS